MAKITTIEIQKRNKVRANIYLDGEYAFSLTLIEAAKLRKGQTLTDADIHALQAEDSVTRAVDHAARFLAYRPRSTEEVRRNLIQQKKYTEITIDTAIQRLEALGYLDDEAFARYWLENRQAFKPRSATALRYELRQKGISDTILDAVLIDIDPYDSAYRAAQDRARRLKNLDRPTFRHKLGGFLQRRGFAYEIIKMITEQLEHELAAENPDFFTDTW